MHVPWPFVLLICVIVISGGLHFLLPHGRSGTKVEPPSDDEFHDAVSGDDDRFWFGNFMYNNRGDPDLFVPKRWGLGWTLNLGHPWGKPLLVGTLIVPLVLVILGALGHR